MQTFTLRTCKKRMQHIVQHVYLHFGRFTMILVARQQRSLKKCPFQLVPAPGRIWEGARISLFRHPEWKGEICTTLKQPEYHFRPYSQSSCCTWSAYHLSTSPINWGIYLDLFSEIHGFDRVSLIWPPIFVLVGAVILLGLTNAALTCIRGLFLVNIDVNGFLPGVLISVYDIFLSLVVVGFAILTMLYIVAIIGLFIMAALFGGGRRVVEINGKYYVVDD